MAATIDFGAGAGLGDSTLGVYGLYNDFYVILDTTTVTYFKHKFRISASIDGVAGTEVVKDVDSIDGRIIINPVEVMKDWFKSFEGDGNYDLLGGKRLKAYNTIRIQVGEVYADLADDPATFRGYDTDNDFNFFNGYNDIDSGEIPAYEYYNWSFWQPATSPTDDFKLPMLKTELQLDTVNDIQQISYFTGIIALDNTTFSNQLFYANVAHIYYYDANGVQLGFDSNSISDINLQGVNSFPITDFDLNLYAWSYIEVYINYNSSASVSNRDTNHITIRRAKENEKYNRFRLRWFNRYAGFEYENFILQSSRDLQVEAGKRILKSNVNQSAATLEAIKYPSQPEVVQVGRSAERVYRLNSDWMSQEQLDALEEMYLSPNVIMFDVNNNIIPVMVMGSTYQISEVKDGLQKVSIELQVANRVKIVKQ